MVALDAIVVGNQVVPGISSDAAIFDTGTSLITTSAVDAATLNGVRGPLLSMLAASMCAWRWQMMVGGYAALGTMLSSSAR